MRAADGPARISFTRQYDDRRRMRRDRRAIHAINTRLPRGSSVGLTVSTIRRRVARRRHAAQSSIFHVEIFDVARKL